MQVTTEQIDPCKIQLTITVESDKVAEAREKAFQKIARNVQIPGFRKGKVPPAMAKAYIDPGRAQQDAAEALVGPAYVEALQQESITPFNGLNPEMELVEMNEGGPLVFKAYVPLPPVVTLGPYKGLDMERRRLEVDNDDVEQQIEQLRTRYAEYPEIKDRAVQSGDLVLADVATTVHADADTEEETAPTQSAVIEVGKNIADFDNGVLGTEIGETRTIDAMYPADYAEENLRGKRVTFIVTVNEIREKKLPDLNDELVQKAHPTAKTPEELTTILHDALEKAADEMADNDLEFRLVSQIVDGSQINYPDALRQVEMNEDVKQLQERIKQENMTLEQYFERVGQTPEQVEAQIAQAADRRIRNSLVLAEIARSENIELQDADVDAIINERAERSKVSPAAVRAFAEKNDQMNRFRDQALTQKILGFLKDSATITERTVTEEELEAESENEPMTEADLPDPEEVAEMGEAAPLVIEAPRARRKSSDATGAEASANEDTALNNAPSLPTDEATGEASVESGTVPSGAATTEAPDAGTTPTTEPETELTPEGATAETSVESGTLPAQTAGAINAATE